MSSVFTLRITYLFQTQDLVTCKIKLILHIILMIVRRIVYFRFYSGFYCFKKTVWIDGDTTCNELCHNVLFYVFINIVVECVVVCLWVMIVVGEELAW